MFSILQVKIPVVVATILRQNSNYVLVYIVYMNLLFNGFIPLILLVTLNVLVYSRLRQFSSCVDSTIRGQSVQRRELLLAKISCLIVAGRGQGPRPHVAIDILLRYKFRDHMQKVRLPSRKLTEISRFQNLVRLRFQEAA